MRGGSRKLRNAYVSIALPEVINTSLLHKTPHLKSSGMPFISVFWLLVYSRNKLNLQCSWFLILILYPLIEQVDICLKGYLCFVSVFVQILYNFQFPMNINLAEQGKANKLFIIRRSLQIVNIKGICIQFIQSCE